MGQWRGRLGGGVQEGHRSGEAIDFGGEGQPYHRCAASVLQFCQQTLTTTGSGWQQEQCVGQTGGVPRLGIRGQCLQDSPVGVRYTEYVHTETKSVI